MNIWECDEPGCKRTVVGCGGAIGLRAIGWYFKRGPEIKCPEHHPFRSAQTDAEFIQGRIESICGINFYAG